MDMQMGFSMANVIDPLTGTQRPMLGNFKFMIAVIVVSIFERSSLFDYMRLWTVINGCRYLMRLLLISIMVKYLIF